MVEKRIVFTPEFIPQYQRRQIKGLEDAQKRAVIFRKNLSTFYTSMYAALSGGVVQREFKMGEYLELPNGEKRSILSDIVEEKRYGSIDKEVKASSIRLGRFNVPKNQLENYLYRLMKKLDEGQQFPHSEYAIFKYGDWAPMNLHLLTNWKLQSTLSTKVRSLLVVPLNAILYMTQLPMTNLREHNQETSIFSNGHVNYWHVPGKYINLGHNKELFPKADHGNLEKLLFIDKLEVSQQLSPNNLFARGEKGGEYKVNQFPITRYSIVESEKENWIENLRANHKKIADTIGIRDLYQEQLDFEHLRENSFPWELPTILDMGATYINEEDLEEIFATPKLIRK